jgi:hypothetical protein
MIIQTESRNKKRIPKSVGVIQKMALIVPWRKSIRAETKMRCFLLDDYTHAILFSVLNFVSFIKKKNRKTISAVLIILLYNTTTELLSLSLHITQSVYNISANNFFITEIGFWLLLGSLLLNISIETWINRNETWDTLYITKPRWRVLSPLLFFLISLF